MDPENSIFSSEVINCTEWRPAFDRSAQELFTELYFSKAGQNLIEGEKPIVNKLTRAVTKDLIANSTLAEHEGWSNFSSFSNDPRLADAVFIIANWRRDTLRQLINARFGIELEASSTIELLRTALSAGQQGGAKIDIVQFIITQARRELLIQKIGKNYYVTRSVLDADGGIIDQNSYNEIQGTHSTNATETFEEYADIVKDVLITWGYDTQGQLMDTMEANLYGDYSESDKKKQADLALFIFKYINRIAKGDRKKFGEYVKKLGIPVPNQGIKLGEIEFKDILEAAPYIARHFSGMNYTHERD